MLKVNRFLMATAWQRRRQVFQAEQLLLRIRMILIVLKGGLDEKLQIYVRLQPVNNNDSDRNNNCNDDSHDDNVKLLPSGRFRLEGP